MHFFGDRREHPDNLARGAKVRRVQRALVGGVGACIYDTLLDTYVNSRKQRPSFKDERATLKFFVGFWRFLHDQFHFVNDTEREKESQFAQLDAQFVVANRKDIISVDADLTVMKFTKYCAVGSGAAYSYGALHSLYDTRLHARDIARRAAEAAVHFHDSCGGDVLVFDTP
jgi:hypothetical protein